MNVRTWRRRGAALAADRPPYDWPLADLPSLPPVLDGAAVTDAVAALAGGDWLVFVEQSYGARDVGADHYRSVVAALEAAGATPTVVRCDGDPRVAFLDDGTPMTLDALHAEHPDARVAFFGDGAALADISGPFAGTLTVAGEALVQRWTSGALLSPNIPSSQIPGIRGATLRAATLGAWTALPGTLESIRAFGRAGGAAQVAANADALADDAALPPPPDLIGTAPHVEQLRRHWSADNGALFYWLAACAIHRELNRGVALAIGETVERTLGVGALVSEASVVRLLRLTYFREGVLDDDLRAALIDALKNGPANLDAAVRQRWQEVLERPGNIPPEGSFAHARHGVDLARLQPGATPPSGTPEYLREIGGYSAPLAVPWSVPVGAVALLVVAGAVLATMLYKGRAETPSRTIISSPSASPKIAVTAELRRSKINVDTLTFTLAESPSQADLPTVVPKVVFEKSAKLEVLSARLQGRQLVVHASRPFAPGETFTVAVDWQPNVTETATAGWRFTPFRGEIGIPNAKDVNERKEESSNQKRDQDEPGSSDKAGTSSSILNILKGNGSNEDERVSVDPIKVVIDRLRYLEKEQTFSVECSGIDPRLVATYLQVTIDGVACVRVVPGSSVFRATSPLTIGRHQVTARWTVTRATVRGVAYTFVGGDSLVVDVAASKKQDAPVTPTLRIVGAHFELPDRILVNVQPAPSREVLAVASQRMKRPDGTTVWEARDEEIVLVGIAPGRVKREVEVSWSGSFSHPDVGDWQLAGSAHVTIPAEKVKVIEAETVVPTPQAMLFMAVLSPKSETLVLTYEGTIPDNPERWASKVTEVRLGKSAVTVLSAKTGLGNTVVLQLMPGYEALEGTVRWSGKIDNVTLTGTATIQLR